MPDFSYIRGCVPDAGVLDASNPSNIFLKLWIDGATTLDGIANKPWVPDDINHAVDTEILDGDNDFPYAIYMAARLRLKARKESKSFRDSCNTTNLPPTSATATEDVKKLLLQFVHFAHVLGIQPLMKAVMHALCSAVYRSPEGR
ncbi:hypothetical protein AYO21_00195 [Fonsecaea monophora]|uniref:Uncharacterized protein n=1 Tax=Fonsecaea monophora TaxID=254056 RepID=A0A177FQY5_9EURO|nr:hypothetical protein AYO21_00195 [Fonsecaea monophora]KAH0842179.1 hypothetical protein FOPE_07717 [Fonsecaea pedrosoi]OAG45559.1 hypothetical protein AYO21_00195 [Fonsecaea monophora]